MPAPVGAAALSDLKEECRLEATPTEWATQVQTDELQADPDWQVFQESCYREEGKPGPRQLQKGVKHLVKAAQRGHVFAQYQMATELHVGRGRLGIQEDVRTAALWYAEAANNGYPGAVMCLAMLYAAHPEVPRKHIEACRYLPPLDQEQPS